jgi:integrase
MKDQANDLLNAPDPQTLTGKRDRTILAVLLGCGLRRAELLRINVEDLHREGRWVLPDMTGKGTGLDILAHESSLNATRRTPLCPITINLRIAETRRPAQ